MNGRAQAGLEYLVTYGWALVLIAAVVGVLVFVATPSESASFSSSEPGKVMVKGSSIGTGSVTIKLQNISGGVIAITQAVVPGGYAYCKINSIDTAAISSANAIELQAGQEALVECFAATDFKQPVILKYLDYAGLEKSVEIKGGGKPAEISGKISACNEVIDDARVLADGGTGIYTLANGIANCSGIALKITADNVTLNCGGKGITGSPGTIGIHLDNAENARVANCLVSGFRQGIFLSQGGWHRISGNTAEGNMNEGISVNYSSNNVLSGNALSGSRRGLVVSNSSGNTINGNNACGNVTMDIQCSNSTQVGSGNTANGEKVSCDGLVGTAECPE